MENLIKKYADKLAGCGLCDPGTPLLGGYDDTIYWTGPQDGREVLEEIMISGGLNSILLAKPREPYASIIDFLARQTDGCITPSDCETRTFLHDLPVVENFSADTVGAALSNRKCAIIPGRGIITYGTVSPEQAFVAFSSVCFACFVNFFSTALQKAESGELDDEFAELLDKSATLLDPLAENPSKLMRGPFKNEEDVFAAVSEAGRQTVEHRLVDSFFGNVSCTFNGTMYISQTGSSLDEMEGCIDPCPMDGSSCAALTASSELSAHRRVAEKGFSTILHGHPKFSVIMSLYCEHKTCHNMGRCHLDCPEERFVNDTRIVPGEVGTGPTGLCNTMPPALENGARGVIVYGHGVFCCGQDDFNVPFGNLLNIERECRDRYFELLAGFRRK